MNGYKFYLYHNHCHKNISLNDFVRLLIKDCLDNKYSKEIGSERAFNIGIPEPNFVPPFASLPTEFLEKILSGVT